MQKNFHEIQSKAIAKAWKDPDFKKRLLENPKKALRELGYDLPQEVTVIAQEEKKNEFHFFLPPAPADVQKLEDTELTQQAASWCVGGGGGCWTNSQ